VADMGKGRKERKEGRKEMKKKRDGGTSISNERYPFA